MATLLVHISLLAYAAGAAAFLTWVVKPGPRWVRLGRLLLVAGVLLHFGAFGVALGSADANVAAVGLGAGEWKGSQLFSLLAAITVAGYLLLDWRYDFPASGAFASPFTVAAIVTPLLVPSPSDTGLPLASPTVPLFNPASPAMPWAPALRAALAR